MLFTTALGIICTLLLTVDASGTRKTKERVFYDEGDSKSHTRIKTVPKSTQRFQWLINAFHNTLFETMALKADFLAAQLGTTSTKDNFDQVWAPYLEAILGSFEKRAIILEDELRKVFVKSYGVPVDTENQALRVFQQEITRKTEEAEEEAEDKEADKKAIQKEKERQLRRREKEIKEVKREQDKHHRRQDLKRIEKRGFTPVSVSRGRKGAYTSSDSSDSE